MLIGATAVFALSLTLADALAARNSCRSRTRARSSSASRRRSIPRSAFTQGKLVQAEAVLQKHPEIDHFFAAIGGFTSDTGAADGAVTDGQVNSALIYVTMKPKSQRSVGQFALMNELRERTGEDSRHAGRAAGLRLARFRGGARLSDRAESARDRLPGARTKIRRDHRRDEEDRATSATSTPISAPACPRCASIPNRALATESGVSVDTIADTVQRGHRRHGAGPVHEQGPALRRAPAAGGRRSALDPTDITNLDVRTDYNELIPISQRDHDEDGRAPTRPSRARCASGRSRSTPTSRPASRRRRRWTARRPSRTRRHAARLPRLPRRRARRPSARPSRASSSRSGSASSCPTWCWRRSSTASSIRSPCCWRCRSA